jgi:hypothetical protein
MRLLCLSVLALSVFAFSSGFADDQHGGAFEECAKACNDCQRSCDMCSSHCAKMVADGKKDHLTTLETCQDCATHCSAAASIVARKGPFSDTICKACAEACKRCGDACEKFNDDSMMKKCADECRKCEKACQEMLKHVGTNK